MAAHRRKYPWSLLYQRWRNHRLNRKEYRHRRVVLESYPTVAIVDPTNICNLRCPLCATGTRTSNHTKGKMSLELFKQILRQLGPYLYQLHLYNWGEPLLHEGLCELIEYAKAHYPAKVMLSSNLNTLSDELAERIVASGLDKITVAVDAMSEETYQKYRVGGSWKKLMTNLKKLIETKKRKGADKPEIYFRFMLMKHNVHELEAARKKAEELGCTFMKKTVRVDMADFHEGSIHEKIERYQEWLPEQVEYNRYKRHLERLQKGRVCKDLWLRTFISWDGAVTPCCNIYQVEDFFATSLDSDFRKIWNGEKYTAARRLFRGEPVDDKLNLVCKRCVQQGNNIWVS